MTKTWFSRIILRRDAHVRAIAELLLPEADRHPTRQNGDTLNARHRLLWSLFPDAPDAKRDFLWREEKDGGFLVLSARQPRPGEYFHVESKEWAPALSPGDHLLFALRANPVISRKQPGSRRGQRHDFVMDALKQHPEYFSGRLEQQERRNIRNDIIARAGGEWLSRHGAKHGFEVIAARSDGYRQHVIPRKKGTTPMRFSSLDIEGRLKVTEPEKFLTRLASGFGAARAFGCGLMLIRRT